MIKMKLLAIILLIIFFCTVGVALSGCANMNTTRIEGLIDSLDQNVSRYQIGCDKSKTPPCEIYVGLVGGVKVSGKGKDLSEAWENLRGGLGL